MWYNKIKLYLSKKNIVNIFLTIYLTNPPKPYPFVRFLKQSINFTGALATAAVTTTGFTISIFWKKAVLCALLTTFIRAAIPNVIHTLSEIEVEYIFTTVNYMTDVIWDIRRFWDGNPTLEDQSVLYHWLCMYVQSLEIVYNHLVRMLNLADSLGLQDSPLYDRAEIISIDFYNGLDYLKNILLVLKDSLNL